MRFLSRFQRVGTRLAFLAVLLFSLSGFPCRAQPSASFKLPPPENALEAMRISVYHYDADLPLNAKLEKIPSKTGSRYNLSYDSIHDQRVTATLMIPEKSATPCPAVIVMHGSGGDKNANYVSLVCSEMCRRGYAAISIDGQYRGDRAKPGKTGDLRPDSYAMRDIWVQDVVDLRRAVDYLQSRPDIDKNKIGFVGFSMGAMLGSTLGGVEERISCFLLAVPGGGFVELAKNVDKYPLLKEKWPIVVSPEVMKRVEEFASVTDPIYFVGRIEPRPLLVLVAKQDEIIPYAATKALIEAGHIKPSNVMTIASGHALNPAVLFTIRDFMSAHLGVRN